jgi:hypothetical protein
MIIQKCGLESFIAFIFTVATLVDTPSELVHSRSSISPIRQVSGKTPEGVDAYHSSKILIVQPTMTYTGGEG